MTGTGWGQSSSPACDCQLRSGVLPGFTSARARTTGCAPLRASSTGSRFTRAGAILLFMPCYGPEVEGIQRRASKLAAAATMIWRRYFGLTRRSTFSGLAGHRRQMSADVTRWRADPSLLHQRLVRHFVDRYASAALNGSLKPVLQRGGDDGSGAPRRLRLTDNLDSPPRSEPSHEQASTLIRERITDSRFRHLYDLRRIEFHRQDQVLAPGVRHCSRSTFGSIRYMGRWCDACHLPDSMVRSEPVTSGGYRSRGGCSLAATTSRPDGSAGLPGGRVYPGYRVRP